MEAGLNLLSTVGETTSIGRKDAFEVFVETHKDGLVNYLHNLTSDRDRAEELAQEAFLRVFRARGDYGGEPEARAYLYTTATNIVRSEYRRSYRWAKIVPRLRGVDTATDRDPVETVLGDEARRRVRQAISDLPLRFRSPLVLRDIEGWSYEEIAETLECRPGTVKSRISRARERLREALAPYWNGEE